VPPLTYKDFLIMPREPQNNLNLSGSTKLIVLKVN
jgi:hypothetical protein